MTLRIVIDMNLSPEWEAVLEHHGWPAIHWSRVGDPRAPDREIMDWASAHGYAVFTHDLDFGSILALTHTKGPSVLQVRAADVLPEHLERMVVTALQQHEGDLESGALVVVDESRSRVRVLPI